MKLTITKEFLFAAAHKLQRKDCTDRENYEYYGSCSRIHGHTYRLQVTVTGPIKPDGMIINFTSLKYLVQYAILDRYDHHFLNDLEEYKDLPTTVENIINQIFLTLDPLLKKIGITLSSLILYETPTSWATWTRDEIVS